MAGRRVQRAETMGSLLKSIASIVIFAVFGITAIAELGFDIGPIIASAGIIGVALGFGAQSLVKDFLSGIFMIFEDQYGVGDVVDLGEASGTVEAVSLRVTRLRDVNGTVWYVRNGEILRVGNMSQNWARTVLDVPVALRRGPRAGCGGCCSEVAHDLWDDEDFERRDHRGARGLGRRGADPRRVTLRVTLKTAPMEQWAVAREMRAADQGPLRPRGHRDPAPPARGLAPRQRRRHGARRGAERPGVDVEPALTAGRLARARQASAASSVIVVPVSAWLDRAVRLGVLGGRDEVVVARCPRPRRARSAGCR